MSVTDAAQSVNDSHQAHNRQCPHRVFAGNEGLSVEGE